MTDKFLEDIEFRGAQAMKQPTIAEVEAEDWANREVDKFLTFSRVSPEGTVNQYDVFTICQRAFFEGAKSLMEWAEAKKELRAYFKEEWQK